jgi:hypothetical protein
MAVGRYSPPIAYQIGGIRLLENLCHYDWCVVFGPPIFIQRSPPSYLSLCPRASQLVTHKAPLRHGSAIL